MKKLFALLLTLSLVLALAACGDKTPGGRLSIPPPSGSSQGAGTAGQNSAQKEEGYIWTLTIDQEQTQVVDADVGASLLMKLKLSMSKEGGDDPFGAYRGELYYEQDTDFGILAAFLQTADANIWGKNDTFEIELLPYDETQMDEFEESLTSGAKEPEDMEEPNPSEPWFPSLAPLVPETSGPSLAPLIEIHAMHFAPDIPFTEKDFGIDVSVPEGLLDIHGGDDDDTYDASVDLGEFGAASVSGEAPLPYSITLKSNTGSDDMYVIFTLYLHDGSTYVFRGTIDKIPLSDTISVDD